MILRLFLAACIGVLAGSCASGQESGHEKSPAAAGMILTVDAKPESDELVIRLGNTGDNAIAYVPTAEFDRSKCTSGLSLKITDFDGNIVTKVDEYHPEGWIFFGELSSTVCTLPFELMLLERASTREWKTSLSGQLCFLSRWAAELTDGQEYLVYAKYTVYTDRWLKRYVEAQSGPVKIRFSPSCESRKLQIVDPENRK